MDGYDRVWWGKPLGRIPKKPYFHIEEGRRAGGTMEEEGGGKARPNEEDEEATSTMEARPSEQEHVPYVICSPSSPSSSSSSVSLLFCLLFSWERRRIRQEVTRIVQFPGETLTPPSVSTFIGSIRLRSFNILFRLFSVTCSQVSLPVGVLSTSDSISILAIHKPNSQN